MSDPVLSPPAPRGYLNWWQGLILAASSALIGVVVAIYIKGGGSAPGGAPNWAMTILHFIPHFLMLFGILADAFTYEGVYWTGTAVGVLAIFVGPLIAGAFTQLGKIPEYLSQRGGRQRGGEDGYPGIKLTSMDNPGGTPETLVITAAILSYYIFDLMFSISVLDAAGAIVAGVFLFGGQAMSISKEMGDSPGLTATLAGLAGSIIGGGSYTALNSWAPQYLPSNVLVGSATSGGGATRGTGSGPGRQGLGMSSGNTPLADGSGVPGSAKTCAK
jgi:hypothetical protein